MTLEQNLKRTHAIYDNFVILARFVENRATKAEAAALLEALSPLNKAICEKLEIPPGATIQLAADGSKV